MAFHLAVTLFGLYMLARYGPRAVRELRSRPPDGRPRGPVPLVNLLLALAILVLGVKGLAAALITP